MLQTAALIRAQNTQRVLYEISLLASTTLDRSAFLQGIHEQLGTLIDAENFYVALYDRQSGKITYPYYIDRFDDEAMAHETFEFIDADRMSLTGYVLSSGQPLFLDAACIEQAKADNRFYSVGRLPEFWMGAPLKTHRTKSLAWSRCRFMTCLVSTVPRIVHCSPWCRATWPWH